MKYGLSLLVLLFSFFSFQEALATENLVAAEATQYRSNSPWYWTRGYYQNTEQPRYNTGVRYPSYLRRTTQSQSPFTVGGYQPSSVMSPTSTYSRSSLRPASYRNTSTTRNYRYPNTPSRTSTTRTYTPPRSYNRYRYNTRNRLNSSSSSRRTSSRRSLSSTTRSSQSSYRLQDTHDFAQPTVSVRPLNIDRDFTEGRKTKTPVLQVGFSNRSAQSRSTLPPVYELRKIRLKLQDREGVFIDFSDFFLEVDGQRVNFDRDGDTTISLQGMRASSGESKSFEVYLGLRDTSTLPRRYGALRLVLEDAEVTKEFSGRPANYKISGDRSSNFITFFPTPGVTPGNVGSITGNTSVNIFGKNLSAGSSEKVLAIRLQSNYDDIAINNLTVRETLSGGSIDRWSDKVEIIDEATGQVLETSRFTGGKAVFHFRPSVVIDRGSQSLLSLRLYLSDPLRVDNQNTSFKLMVSSSDIEAFSASTGNAITAKIVDIDSETFTVSGATGGVSTSGSQPAFAATGAPHQLFRFRVNNPSRGYISVSRMSFSVRGVGAEFAGGSISTSDFRLRQYASGQNHDVGFSPVLASGNRVVFDHSSELTIPPGESFTFTLYGAFDDLPGDSAYATVQVLGDSSFTKGTQSQVEASGANFIWSDNSSRPHSISSGDWLNGYRFSGITSNAVIIR